MSYSVPQHRHDFQPTACSGDTPDRLQQLTEKTRKMKTKRKRKKARRLGTGSTVVPTEL